MNTYFISDLHLEEGNPSLVNVFLNFLENRAIHADALYILGDLFEAWIGDDDKSSFAIKIKSALLALTKKTPVFFIRGNRDFLVGALFEKMTGVKVLGDPCLINLYGKRVLLSHGDIFCIGDIKYQAFRQKVHQSSFQKNFYKLPLFLRRYLAKIARKKSKHHTGGVSLSLQDIDQAYLEEVISQEPYKNTHLIIHGHTHKTAIHHFDREGNSYYRIVLDAWHDRGSVLVYTAEHHYFFEILAD